MNHGSAPRLCTLLLLLLSATPAFAADHLEISRPEDVGMSSERLERVTRSMQGYVDRGEVPGVVTLIARRGRVVHLEAVGQRDVENSQPMTTDTIFRIASMTKPIASVALMVLYEEGLLGLRDPISEWLPEFAEPTVLVEPAADEYVGVPYVPVPAARQITVQHVLTHTAGFANNYRGPQTEAYRALREQREPGSTVADYIEQLAKLPLDHHPGDHWRYGPSTEVVGRLVEVISGQTLDDFLRERILEPLGMPDTHFYLPSEKLDRFAALYEPGDDGTIELTEAPDASSRYVREPHVYFSASGGLVSTAADYFRFHQMMLDGGELDGVRLLGRKTVELMTTNHTGDKGIWLTGPGHGFGLGYSVVTELGPSGVSGSPGTYAWGGAFCTVFWVDPVEQLIGIMMTQVRPYTHLDIRHDFRVLAYQAIVD
jgi:CubicO group peptidase (beta-lactamase class C family)